MACERSSETLNMYTELLVYNKYISIYISWSLRVTVRYNHRNLISSFKYNVTVFLSTPVPAG